MRYRFTNLGNFCSRNVLLEIFLSLAILASTQMIKIIQKHISESEVQGFLGKPYEKMIKFVADIKRECLALGGEMHADAERVLLDDGSKQMDLWGGNYYPLDGKKIEYNSFINIRPSAGNRSMDVRDERIRNQMQEIVRRLLR